MTKPTLLISNIVTTIVSALALSQSASAMADGQSENKLWNDQNGFISADACVATTEKDIAFRVDESPLHSRLLVVAGEGDKKKSLLRDAGDYVIEIASKESANQKLAQTFASKFAGSGKNSASSFWQVSMQGDNYDVLRCGPDKKPFVVFSVFVPESHLPVARVGVNAGEMALFRKIEVHTPDEAEKAIGAQTKNALTSVDELEEQSVLKGRTARRLPTRRPPSAATGFTRGRAPHAAKAPSVPAADPKSVPKSALPVPTPPARPTSPVADAPVTTSTPAPVSPSAQPSPTPSAAPLANEASPPAAAPATPGTTNAALDYVICVGEGDVQVRGQNLEQILFVADLLEEVKPVQSFGNDRQTRTVGGKTYKYVKVQFAQRPDNANIGWVAEPFVKLRSNCAFTNGRNDDSEGSTNDRGDDTIMTDNVIAKILNTITDSFKFMNSSDCCNFPTKGRPEDSYLLGQRRFRADRAGGSRIHAACDLYRPDGEAVSSLAPGEIVRGKYFFYQGVFAVEVRHPGNFIARYGEVKGKSAKGTKQGRMLRRGQTLGYVGTVNSGCCSPMLHFELYSGHSTGSLSQPWRGGFQRRSDLMDPTGYLQRWEKAKFGENYY